MNIRPLKIGLIGCGGFARGMHLPLIKANPKYHLAAACDVNLPAAEAVQKEFNAQYTTTEPEKVFADKEVDAVLIVTRHDTHASLSIKAAEAHKHILCEKPMGLNLEECVRVAKAVRKANVNYTVGYNRGMAPLVLKAKELLAGEKAKRLIYHRIQAPFPPEQWTHIPNVGGGRFVGEGCHIFDLLCELIPAPPVSVYAAGGIFLDPAKVKIPDSGIVTIVFADGSVGTTLIASDGCAQFPKESTEIYCGGKAIHINDFREMSYHGFIENGEGRIALAATDKGHRRELDLFADSILNKTEPPNGINKALRAALISFKVNESIRRNIPILISEYEHNF